MKQHNMHCPKHPDLEAKYRCEKYEVWMCERCLECRSPETHCKHRQQCIIWELFEDRHEGGAESDE